MIVPARRLLWFAALAVVPLAGAAGFDPRVAVPCLAVLALIAVFVAIDAVLSVRAVSAIGLSAPESRRLTKAVAASFPITIENRGAATVTVRLGAVMPEGMESSQLVEEIQAPAGTSQYDWPCTGGARGDHVLRELHVEMR